MKKISIQKLLSLSLILAPTMLLTACWGQTTTTRPPITPPDNISTSQLPPIINQDNSPTANNPQYSIYLIALEDKGLNGTEVGCGDSISPVIEDSKIPNATENQLLNEAFTTLLTTPKEDIDSGFSNFLFDSKLKLDSAEIKDGVATVKLSGQLSLAGECDDPRVQAQLENTAKQFDDVKSVGIFINGKSLNSLMSLK